MGSLYDYDLDKKLMKKKAVNLKKLFERKDFIGGTVPEASRYF